MDQMNIASEFSSMAALAKAYFERENQSKYQFHQCLVLRTQQGKETLYSFKCDTVTDLVNQSCAILPQIMVGIDKILCMWGSGSIDVPSGAFLKGLCRLREENKYAEVLLNGGASGYVTKKVVDILGEVSL